MSSGIAARCFQGLSDTSDRTAGDYLSQKKQKVLYKSMRGSVQDGNPTQRKKNGVAYNETVGIQMCGLKNPGWNPYPGRPPLPSGRLASAHSYEMLMDMAKGKHLINPAFAGAESLKYGSWLSQLIAINYNGPQNTGGDIADWRIRGGFAQATPVRGLSVGANPSGYPGLEGDPSMNNMITFPLPPDDHSAKTNTAVFGADASWNPSAAPGYELDPNNTILAPWVDNAGFLCVRPDGAKALGYWIRLAVPTHQDQPGFWRGVNAQPLNGFGTAGGFAQDITFSVDMQDGNTGLRRGFIQQAFGPAMSARSAGPYSCLPTNGELDPPLVQGLQEQGWHRVGGGGAFSKPPPPSGSGLPAQAHRLPGFMSRCALQAGCNGFDKLN